MPRNCRRQCAGEPAVLGINNGLANGNHEAHRIIQLQFYVCLNDRSGAATWVIAGMVPFARLFPITGAIDRQRIVRFMFVGSVVTMVLTGVAVRVFLCDSRGVTVRGVTDVRVMPATSQY